MILYKKRLNIGFIIDKRLNLNEHIVYTCRKFGKKIGFLKRIRNRISKSTAVTIYNTIIKPHSEYFHYIVHMQYRNSIDENAETSK